MKRIFRSAALCLFILTALHAGEAPLPKTAEEQLKYLEGALSESFRTRDFAMLEMAVKGFAAAKLPEKDLEISILRAERDAAFGNIQSYGMMTPAAAIETWGLMARAKLGNAAALATLHKLVDEPLDTPAALPAFGKVPPAEFLAKQQVLNDYAAAVRKRNHALLALALLKEPKIQEKALAIIVARCTECDQQVRVMNYSAGGTDPAILAVLEANAESGFKQLLEYCSEEKLPVKDQAAALGELFTFLSPRNFGGAEEKFTIVSDIRSRMPKDAQQQLIPAYVGILKRYTPDPKQQWDATLNTITSIAFMLPDKSIPPEGIAALETLTNALPGPKEQYPKQQFVQLLKKYGKDLNEPVKPPKAEKQDF
ncbi:MAG TPA: hypothetical protein VKX17_03085 [Planctomycetota bacterium]|nr:hypothetical protein [Planctomycetota bacterium]